MGPWVHLAHEITTCCGSQAIRFAFGGIFHASSCFQKESGTVGAVLVCLLSWIVIQLASMGRCATCLLEATWRNRALCWFRVAEKVGNRVDDRGWCRSYHLSAVCCWRDTQSGAGGLRCCVTSSGRPNGGLASKAVNNTSCWNDVLVRYLLVSKRNASQRSCTILGTRRCQEAV